MAGQSALNAIVRQLDTLHIRHRENAPRASSSSTLLKLDDDGSVWIGGVRFTPDTQAERAAPADIDTVTTPADQGEYLDWAPGNSDAVVDTADMATLLMASTESSRLAHKPEDLPLNLNSRASTHISCVRSDFSELRPLEPRRITGAGNSSVYATGIGTVEILLPGSHALLTL